MVQIDAWVGDSDGGGGGDGGVWYFYLTTIPVIYSLSNSPFITHLH